MRRYLNGANLPLSMAVFLATDSYDHDPRENVVSVTSLMKPVRQTILASRLPPEEALVDVLQRVNSRLGQAIHNEIERSWLNGVEQALSFLGYPQRVIERVRVNPDPQQLEPDTIPVYLEQRAEKQVGKWIVTGKFDFVGDGRLEDVKTTKVYTYIKGNKDEDYILQGSMYRWLNPKIITRDEMAIQFIFMDWNAGQAQSIDGYPPRPVFEKTFPLKSVSATQAYVERRLALLERYWHAPQEELPRCTDEELWRSEPVWKYYRNPDKTSRATKNFNNPQEAHLRNAKDGGKGLVVQVPGQVQACKYCPAFTLCTQKDDLIADGSLQV